MSPENVGTLAPNVVRIHKGHVHVQVTHVGLLRVGLQTLPQPEGLGALEEGVGYEDEPWKTGKQQAATGNSWVLALTFGFQVYLAE